MNDGVKCKYGPWTIFPDGRLISNITGREKKAFRLKHGKGYWSVTRTEHVGGGKIKTHNYLLHRLVAEHFLGPIPEGMEVCLKDNDKNNVHVSNLVYRTHSENLLHSYQVGVHQSEKLMGQLNGNSKITNEQAQEIVQDLMNGEPVKVLAARYGLSTQYVQHIKAKRRLRRVWDRIESGAV